MDVSGFLPQMLRRSRPAYRVQKKVVPYSESQQGKGPRFEWESLHDVQSHFDLPGLAPLSLSDLTRVTMFCFGQDMGPSSGIYRRRYLESEWYSAACVLIAHTSVIRYDGQTWERGVE